MNSRSITSMIHPNLQLHISVDSDVNVQPSSSRHGGAQPWWIGTATTPHRGGATDAGRAAQVLTHLSREGVDSWNRKGGKVYCGTIFIIILLCGEWTTMRQYQVELQRLRYWTVGGLSGQVEVETQRFCLRKRPEETRPPKSFSSTMTYFPLWHNVRLAQTHFLK